MSDDAIDRASQAYDRAEQAYIAAVASGADDEALRRLAKQVAEAAQEWSSAHNADNADAPRRGIARYYDVPEVLSTLWNDLSDAYNRRAS